ncbi:MAG: class I SAM-dependent methyltransferase [Bacteroidales bacterium]
MKCPLCDSRVDVFRVYRTLDFFLSKEEFEIWECDHCKIRYTHPFPSLSDLAKYYKSPEYFSHAQHRKNLFSLLYDTIRSINVKWKANQIKAFYPIQGKILDVGCGAGSFLVEMKKRGWECTGVEPNAESRYFIKSQWNIPVYEDISLLDDKLSFQVISLWHVLEHFTDPLTSLTRIKHFLTDDGVLVVAVPNFESLDAATFGSYWAAYDVPRHLYHFSLAGLKSLLDKAGYEIVQVKSIWVDVFYISYLSYRYLDKSLPLFRGFLKSLEILLRANNITDYSSIVVFARKKAE